MNIWAKYLGLFSWVVLIYVVGILLFARGFLLKRVVVEQNSTCETDFTHSDSHGGGGCWMHPSYKKTVIIVIDALRYDFVAEVKDPKFAYHNKLTIIQEKLSTAPKKSKLYRFIADPPTTTMQRIKGLTTGSLPTFVDAGGNFASEEIKEDNFIDQFIVLKKNIVFMGDDTWAGLFPNRFLRAYNYPSLNVKDLHTVDNGVLEHLGPEMAKKDWDVLIAHFLGVDHCGHTFGPYHSAMEDKLKQMNKAISDVMSRLDDETLLVVLGDHGMTRTGDHGGDSQDELEAALFMYSKQQLTATTQPEVSTVRQIDLVPTLSLLLGAPIPYSNLGMIIPDLFTYCPLWKNELTPIKQKYHTVKALHINAHQVHQYLQTYAEVTGEFPRDKYAEQEWLFQTTEEQLQELVTAIAHGESPDTLRKLEKLEKDYKRYMGSVLLMCQDIWAKFDLGSMVLGLAAVIKALFMSVYLYNMVESKAELSAQILAALTTSVWAVLLFSFLSVLGLKLAGMIAALVTGISVIALFGLIIYKIASTNSEASKSQPKQASRKLLYFSVGIMLLHNVSLLSNSFVVFEDSVTAFLVQSVAWAMLLATLYKHATKPKAPTSKKFDFGRAITSPYFILFALTLGFCACVRFTELFKACREEQTSPSWACEISFFLQPLAALTEQSYKNARYFLSIALLVVTVISTRFWLQHQGNMNGNAWTILCVRYALPSMAVCVALYWALLSAPQKVLDSLPPWQLTFLPRLAYMLCALVIISVWLKPLCVFLVKRDNNQDSAIPMFSEDDLVPKVYTHLKQHWREHLAGNKEKAQPLAYGLASVYSAAIIVLVVSVVLLCMLLLGNGLAPSMTLLVLALFLALELHAAYCYLHPQAHENRYDVPFCSVLLLSLLSSTFFFASGHQATIANIHWHPAFVGFTGDHTIYAIPALLIGTETFSAIIVCALALPLLVCWPRIRGKLAYVFEKKDAGMTEAEKKGEFVLNEDDVGLWSAMFRLLMSVLIIHGSKVLFAMICAALHRRHLMVWKIFAPRLVYEGATFFVICIVCFIDFLFVLRIDKAVDSWVNRLDNSS